MKNLELSKEYNIRDLGGIPTIDSQYVRNRLFIRSTALTDLERDDLDKVINDYNVKTIIDLRNLTEKKLYPDPKIKGVNYYHIPILSREADGVTRDDSKVLLDKIPNMSETYLGMVRNVDSLRQIRKVIKLFLNSKNRCILFHCSVGKDRTGLIAFIVLSMLGVEEDEILKDYLYTNHVQKEEAGRYYDYIYSKTHDEEYAKEYSDIFLAKEEFIKGAIDYMKDEYGSVLDFIIYGLGISKKKILKFRNECLEGNL